MVDRVREDEVGMPVEMLVGVREPSRMMRPGRAHRWAGRVDMTMPVRVVIRVRVSEVDVDEAGLVELVEEAVVDSGEVVVVVVDSDKEEVEAAAVAVPVEEGAVVDKEEVEDEDHSVFDNLLLRHPTRALLRLQTMRLVDGDGGQALKGDKRGRNATLLRNSLALSLRFTFCTTHMRKRRKI